MASGEATYGRWSNTRTYPTRRRQGGGVDQSVRSFQQQIAVREPNQGVQPFTEEGTVRELILNVDVFKRFGLDRNSSAAMAFLGPLASDAFGQVTIRTAARTEKGNHWRFTFLVSRKLLDRVGPVKGDHVICKLCPVSVPGNGVVWVCDDLKGLDYPVIDVAPVAESLDLELEEREQGIALDFVC